MRKLLRHRPSPAMIVACTALIFAMGGTGYAAIKLPKNSVGPRQIKSNAVSASKVKDRSLLATDFAAGQLPAGPQGPAGPAGPAGSTGPRGPSDAIYKRDPSFVDVTGAKTTVVSVTLPAGSWVVTGGGVVNNNASANSNAGCELNIAGVVVDTEDLIVLGPNLAVGERESVTLTGAKTVTTPTPAQFRCSLSSASGNVVRPHISAIQVASLSLP